MKFKALLLIPFISIGLGSCSILDDIIDPDKDVDISKPLQDDKGDGYEKRTSLRMNLHDINKTIGSLDMPSVGNPKLLIVPVECSDAPSFTENRLSIVNKAFFGSSTDTYWESVKSYYKIASYGKLDIEGEVAPVFKTNLTVDQLKSQGGGNPDRIVVDMFEADSSYKEYRARSDSDGDGYVDAVAFIYNAPIEHDSGFWAWVTRNSSYPSTTNPAVCAYMWASYDFIFEVNVGTRGSGIDSHTFIHETGHLLGLNDYYPYEGEYYPTGCLDMMTLNIGDQDIYSKMSLGWVDPYYVSTDNEVTLKLRSSALYGDAIILKNNWNGSANDEYIAIEYYTPEGNNEQDATVKYPGRNLQMYTIPGFRIYHIDSRVAELDNYGQYVGIVNKLEKNKYYVIAPCNSESRSWFKSPTARKNFKQISLMESCGENTFKQGLYADNDTLFRKGSSFQATSEFFYYGSKFNDLSEVGYKIEITHSSKKYGEVRIKKIA